MSELSGFLASVEQMAESLTGGRAKLQTLVEEKFVIPSLAASKTLSEWVRYRSMFGEVEFRQYLLRLAEPKLRALVKRFDKHAGFTTESGLPSVRQHLEALADKTVTPTAAPTNKKPKPTVVVPDLRGIYRQGGNDRVFETIAALDLKALKAVVAAQGLKADVVPGRGADGWRKYIQVALKAELGPRGDAIGELARVNPGFDEE